MSSVLKWIGIVFGALSLFSLGQKLMAFGLSPIMEDFVNIYRASITQIIDVLTYPLPFDISVPTFYAELLAVSSLLSAAMFRTVDNKIFDRGVRIGLALVSGLTAISLISLLFVFSLLVSSDGEIVIDGKTLRRKAGIHWTFAKQILLVVAGAFLFFALNAYGFGQAS